MTGIANAPGVGNGALRLHGGSGYPADRGIEKATWDLRVPRTREGTIAIRRAAIARALRRSIRAEAGATRETNSMARKTGAEASDLFRRMLEAHPAWRLMQDVPAGALGAWARIWRDYQTETFRLWSRMIPVPGAARRPVIDAATDPRFRHGAGPGARSTTSSANPISCRRGRSSRWRTRPGFRRGSSGG